MKIEIIDAADAPGPIDVVPECWDDEKPHELGGGGCWCNPRIDGKYVRHRSVFDAIEAHE